jgi:hypothetical protein
MHLPQALRADTHASARLSATVAIAIALFIVTYPVFDCDLYWHLANGREMFARRQIVNEELFSCSCAGTPFVNHEWLSQIVFYGLWRELGAAGLIGFKWLMSALTVGVLHCSIRKAGADHRTSILLCALAALVGLQNFQVRPELFSLLGIAILGHIIQGIRNGTMNHRALWAMPPIMVAWDWLHGAVYGLVYLATVVAAEDAKLLVPALRTRVTNAGYLTQLNIWFGVTIVAMVANPYGPLTYGHFLILAGGVQGAGTIAELQPIWHAWAEWIPLEFLLLWTLTMLVVDHRRFDPAEALLFLVFGAGAIRYNRMAGVAAIVIVPILARHLASVAPADTGKWVRAVRRVGLMAACIMVAAIGYREKIDRGKGEDSSDDSYMLPSATAFGLGVNEFLTPAGSAAFAMALEMPGNMYNNANLGGYLAYAMTPQRRIFQYNMPPVFGDPTRFVRVPRELDKWEIGYAFAGSDGELTRLFPQKDWAWIYSDYVSTLVVRRSPQYQDIIDEYEIQYFAPEQSRRRFEELAANPISKPRLAFEMGVYLAYTRDDRIAARWRGLLAADSTLASDPRLVELVRMAAAREGLKAAGGSRFVR